MDLKDLSWKKKFFQKRQEDNSSKFERKSRILETTINKEKTIGETKCGGKSNKKK